MLLFPAWNHRLSTILLLLFVPGVVVGETRILTYERDIRPVLKTHCFSCHGESNSTKGGLDVRLHRLLIKGGQSGPALVPGDPNASLLFQKISEGKMPPGEDHLSSLEVDLLETWIAAGAPLESEEPDHIDLDNYLTPEERQFWSFQPLQRPDVPKPEDDSKYLLRSPIDAFVFRKLKERQLEFAEEADKRTLIRRASIDLIGLPPSIDDVSVFLADNAPDAYDRLIDRLLASPHYGERWGRHWLDISGYADSEGYTNEDSVRDFSYKYRDYVIRSFNSDKPFNVFIQEQLAGDELLDSTKGQLSRSQQEKLIATGFLRMAPDGTGSSQVDQGVARNQVIADTIKIVSSSLLGLTVGCAQCHNHRYDPISQKDYYRFRAIFEPAYDWKKWQSPQQRLISLYTETDRTRAMEIEQEAQVIDQDRIAKQKEYIEITLQKELDKVPESLRASLRAAWETPATERTEEQQRLLREFPSVNVSPGSLYLYDSQAADRLKKLAKQSADIRATKPVEDFIRALTEPEHHVPATFLFSRGNHDQPREAVLPGEPTVLSSRESVIPYDDSQIATTGRRLAYAQHLTSGVHPLTGRVLVNRIWMHHFGQGIVETVGDFGSLGDRPSHPELLDWLAIEFINGNWKLKRIHKLIMTSTVYRQSSRKETRDKSKDPDNRFLSRTSLRRMDAETLRDSVLAVSGTLNLKMFGPPVPVKENAVGQFVIGIEKKDGEGKPAADIPLHGEEYRRSVYIQSRRTQPLSLLATFDAPTMTPNCESRNSSTVAPQSLLLMNSSFMVSHARLLAEKVRQSVGDNREEQIKRAWKLTFGRPIEPQELQDAADFLNDQTSHFQSVKSASPPKDDDDMPPSSVLSPDQHALTSFCQALLSSNEFLYID